MILRIYSQPECYGVNLYFGCDSVLLNVNSRLANTTYRFSRHTQIGVSTLFRLERKMVTKRTGNKLKANPDDEEKAADKTKDGRPTKKRKQEHLSQNVVFIHLIDFSVHVVNAKCNSVYGWMGPTGSQYIHTSTSVKSPCMRRDLNNTRIYKSGGDELMYIGIKRRRKMNAKTNRSKHKMKSKVEGRK